MTVLAPRHVDDYVSRRRREGAHDHTIHKELRFVQVNGTKTETRDRVVPVVTPAHRSLLEFAVKYAGGKERAMFAPWSNIRRDLHAACKRAGIAPCSPNDLRRLAGGGGRAAPVHRADDGSVLAAKWPKPRKPKAFRRRGGPGVTPV